LAYEPLKSIRGQVVTDFIVEHSIDQNSDESSNLVSIHSWKLFFDGSACREGQGVGIVLILPRGAIFEQSVRLEYFCTNNQVEYEAILLDLQILSTMGVKHVEAFGDSLLVVQQIANTFQCLDRSLNAYLDKWLEIIALLMILLYSMFSGMKIQFSRKNHMFRFAKLDSPVFSRCIVQKSILLNQVQQNRTVRFLKPDGPEFLGLWANQAKWWWSILMIGGYPWYII
jgi:ribonuclease HI